MGEAILVKAGGLGVDVSDPEDKNIVSWELKTELITQSQQFIVPKAKDQQFSVRLFGGGGGTCIGVTESMFPSGSGNMNFAQLKLKKLDIVPVTIGIAGRNNSGEAGGTTSFGTYLSATGGGLPDIPNHIGAPGGVGGESCFAEKLAGWNGNFPCYIYFTHSGISTYGGGGGGIFINLNENRTGGLKKEDNTTHWNELFFIHGANGGIYGGGGGTTHDQTPRIGGNECGNGGNGIINAKRGKNTVGSLEEFIGYGEFTSNYYSLTLFGGGGYGGNGDKGYNNSYFDSIDNKSNESYTCGGGGGYGANGSHTYLYNSNYYMFNWLCTSGNCVINGGRGGGYGGNYGYGPSDYGAGYSANASYFNKNSDLVKIRLSNAKNGIAIISYYSPVYKN